VRERVVRRELGGYQFPALYCPAVHMGRDLRVVSRSFLAEVLIFSGHAWSVGLEDGHVPALFRIARGALLHNGRCLVHGTDQVLALLPASGLRTVVAQANHVTELTGGSRSRRTRPSRAAIVAGSTAVQLASNRPCTGHQTD
jgi:hypothetical protein